MYVPTHFEESDIAVLHALMRSHPLGAWVTAGDDGLSANHIPFLVDATRGTFGTLSGHVARANPVWKSFSKSVDSLVVFQGPQAYITPNWYPGKEEHGKAVPTWNYVVVHAQGMPRAIEDREWLLGHVTQLTNTHETGETRPWKVTDAPPDYVDSMLKAIVGIEIPISRLSGKWKISQNRPKTDLLGVVDGLLSRGDEMSLKMAALVNKSN